MLTSSVRNDVGLSVLQEHQTEHKKRTIKNICVNWASIKSLKMLITFFSLNLCRFIIWLSLSHFFSFFFFLSYINFTSNGFLNRSAQLTNEQHCWSLRLRNAPSSSLMQLTKHNLTWWVRFDIRLTLLSLFYLILHCWTPIHTLQSRCNSLVSGQR